MFALVPSATLPSKSNINDSEYPCCSASCFERVQIIYNPAAFASQGIVFGAGLRHLEIFNLIPSAFNFGSKYAGHSHVAIATLIVFFCADTPIISLPLHANGLTYPF